jgi:hypothetical protein
MVPSYRCTSPRASSKKRSSTVCMASAPRRAASAVEFAMSQNSTVTSFRSPSRTLRVARILSARCLGVYARGASKRGGSPPINNGCPQEKQNRAASGNSVPHAAQRVERWAPHAMQNRASEGFALPQRGQLTA